MTDTAGIAAAGSALTITGSILGLEYGSFLVGLAGAVFALSFLPAEPAIKRAIGVLITGVFAGYAAPVLIVAIRAFLTWVPAEAVYLIALVLGYTGHGILLPKLRYAVDKLVTAKIDEAAK